MPAMPPGLKDPPIANEQQEKIGDGEMQKTEIKNSISEIAQEESNVKLEQVVSEEILEKNEEGAEALPPKKEKTAEEEWAEMASRGKKKRDRSKDRRSDNDGKDKERSRRSRRRRRSKSGSGERKRDRRRRRNRKRRRSRSNEDENSDGQLEDHGPGLRKRRRGERRHKNLWDVGPEEAEKMGLLKNLPINIGTGGDFMHADRAGRRIYVGNLPLDAKESDVRDFFNAVMIAAGGKDRKPGNSVLGVFLNLNKKFGFVEFRSAIEATQAMDLDGIKFRGLSLKMGRPANYNATASCIAARNAPKLNLAKLGIVSNHVPNGPGKIYVGGIPYNLNAGQVRELLQTYGVLSGLWLSHDPATGLSKGYAFAYYENPDVTQAAIQGLHGLEIGTRRLVVKKHDVAKDWTANTVAGKFAKPAKVTRSLCLLNMVTEDDLKDPNELEDIKNDIALEAQNYGKVLGCIIPGLNQHGRPGPGCGKVYVQFATVEAAGKCKKALQGRSFADRTVVVSYYDDEKFQRQEWF